MVVVLKPNKPSMYFRLDLQVKAVRKTWNYRSSVRLKAVYCWQVSVGVRWTIAAIPKA